MPLSRTTIQGDYVQLTTFDGKSIIMPDGGAYTMGILGGAGAPPTNFITRQGYKQHGVTEVSYNLDKRPLVLQLHRNAACSRALYWSNRAELHDILRHDRNGPMTLTVAENGGSVKRSIIVRADPGAMFSLDPSREAGWYIDEQINLIAFDPIWFDPVTTVLTLSGATQNNLVFPITFPILFGTAGLPFTANITYTGTWYGYPTITLTGPYQTAVITNTTTGISFFMTTAIPSGQVRIINTTPGNLSIVDAAGVSHFGELGPNSDLVDFVLKPDPEVVGGIQTISIILLNAAAGAGASISYNTKYFAL